MNFLKTTDLGGFPFVLDDIRWEQDATRDAIKGLLSTWGEDPNDIYILSGCEIIDLGSVLSVGEGYIAIDGEICHVPAHTEIKETGLQKNYFEIVSTYDPNGNKTFDSGSNYDTHEIREAKIVLGASLPLTRIHYTETPDLKTIIKDYVLDNSGEWANIGTVDLRTNDAVNGLGTSAFLNGATDLNFKYKKIGKTVHVEFRFVGVSIKSAATLGASSFTVFIPEAMKPKDQVKAAGVTASCVGINAGTVTKSQMFAGAIQVLIDPTTFAGGGANGTLVLRNTTDTSSVASFNRAYDAATPPTRGLVIKADTDIIPVWDLYGTFSYEAE